MMPRSPLAFAILSLSLMACGETNRTDPSALPDRPAANDDDMGRPVAPRVAQSGPVRTKVIPSPSPLLGEPFARPTGGGGGGGRQMTTAEAEEAAHTIAETEPEGRTPCARAWSVLRDMHRAYRQKSPRARRGGSRARFMEGCRALPRPVQECMNPRHYAENVESCDRRRRRAARHMRRPPWETDEGAREGAPDTPGSSDELPDEELDDDQYEDEDEAACCPS